MKPLSYCSQNPKVFLFRGKPRVLLCATEHYGAVMNRPFNIQRYLRAAHLGQQTLTRLFLLFREQQSPENPYSTCKPESPDYIAPFKRTGPGLAADGQLRYDLDQPNPEFYERLHQFLTLASDLGINVEITLLSNTYTDSVWALHPFHPANNLCNFKDISWPDYTSTRHAELFSRQCAYVRRIVEETNHYDNILYEVCNEPGGNSESGPTIEEVDAWQQAIAQVIRETERTLPYQHLVAGQQAFAYSMPDGTERAGPDVYQFADQSFRTSLFDVVNMHPLSNMIYGGRSYNLGRFMRAQLKLREFRQYCLDSYAERKPLNMDEDNCASQYKDVDGWTIHRKRAWTALFCGAHYDMIDFSIWPHLEAGTVESQEHIRAWIKYLSIFIHGMDLTRARPLSEFVTGLPPEVVASTLAVSGQTYCVYLADARELNEGVGKEISADALVDLPAGEFHVSLYAPQTGLHSPAVAVENGRPARIKLPCFTHDIVLRIESERNG